MFSNEIVAQLRELIPLQLKHILITTAPVVYAENGRFAVPAQEKLSPTEQLLAYVIGAGVALAVVALFLYAIDVVEKNLTMSLLLVGLVLIVVGIGAWLYLLRPWRKFDDLTTPHYTGHDDHEPEPETKPAPEAEKKPKPEPKIEPAPEPKAEKKPEPAPEPAAEKKPEPKPEPAPVAEKKPEPEPTPEPKPEPKPKPAPEPKAPAEPDDLTLIEGVGKKSAEALAASGITTFAQMAAKTPEDLEEAVKSQKVRLVGSTETWPMQAKLAAQGKMEELEKIKKRIVKGVLQDE